eukprot:CAMPEP_0203683446 /NCGR_PEP_ID=MMETSP0090-20130426/47527_1 /ASSEMBLY_ACC=CAM_ASM_001088 /TAXON_ID=426623 /ORGANISM="Chaetoceros affinis, Strain CCMP159" /LENGTH=744 /DNA_ID=CAMNT_0050552593 /DNA_START=52 /DNA_END=2286 /DNA_ORIENTATION=-
MVAPSNRNRFNKLTVASLCLCVVISVYHSVSSGKILKQFIVKSSFEDAVAVLPGLGGSNTGEDVDDDLGFDDGMADKHEYQDDDDGDNNKDDDNVENEGSGDEEENTSIKVVSTEIKEIEASEETERKEEAVEEVATEEGTSHQQDNNKMNVLIFYPDDWRHDSIGSEKPYVLTPFLDQLAKEGIRFTQNAVTTSICWMSRATLWMGQYSSRHQSYKIKCPRMVLPENWKRSWVSILQQSDYFVGHIGKWQYWNFMPEQLFDWAQIFEGYHWYPRGDKEIHGSTLARMHAVDFLKQRPKDKPFTLSIAFYPPKAEEGIRFTQNAVTTSICWMSRATLWMGQYTSRHQSYKLKCPVFSEAENWKHSWVSILRNSGYHTGHIGKWQYHNDFSSDFDYAQAFEGKHWYSRWGKEIDGSTLARTYAVEFLEKRPKDKPFSLSIAFYPPKPVGMSREPGAQWMPTNETRKLYDNVTIPEPEMNHSYKVLPDFLSSYEKGARGPQVRWYERYRTSEHYQASMKNYYALITGVDQACKEIVDKLKEEGLYNNTMIIFTTDNGMMHGAHGLAGKWYPFQESIRVPLIIYDPRMPKEKVGTLDDSFTLNIDLAETILGAAGIKPDELMQGRDISDLYLPNEKDEHHATASVEVEPWREDFFYEFPHDNERFIASSTALVTKEWKFINWPAHNRQQLFNLEEDPLENNDLFNEMSVKPILDKLRERHDELKGIYHEPDWMKSKCYGGPGLESTK